MNGSTDRRTAANGTQGMTLALGLAFGLLLLAPPDAEAQGFRTFGAGWSAGVTHVTDVNPDAASGADAISPGEGFVVSLYVDTWLGETRRVGLRTQGSFQQPQFDWVDARRSIDTGSADLSLIFRPIAPDDGDILPYLTGGLGLIWYDMGTGSTVTYPAAEALHDGRSRIQPTGVLGLGVDVPIDMDWNRLPVSMRFEVADHISFNSPLRRVSDGERHGAVHHFRLTFGLYSTLRRR